MGNSSDKLGACIENYGEQVKKAGQSLKKSNSEIFIPVETRNIETPNTEPSNMCCICKTHSAELIILPCGHLCESVPDDVSVPLYHSSVQCSSILLYSGSSLRECSSSKYYDPKCHGQRVHEHIQY